MEQSPELKKAIAESPLAKECLSQMKQSNNLLSACRNVTELASRLDQHNFTLNYKNMCTPALKGLYRVYAVIRHLLYPYVSENIFPINAPEKEVQIRVKINPNSTAFNVTIRAPIMDVNFTNVRLNPLTASLIQLNPDTRAMDRIAKEMSPLYFERKFTSSYTFIFSILILCTLVVRIPGYRT
jgi:hypothetical protein